MSAAAKMEQLEQVLSAPPAARTDAQIDQVFAFFRNTKFFRALGAGDDGAEKGRQCCKQLALHAFQENETICVQGEHGDSFYQIITGTVRVVINGNAVAEMGPGASFGEIAVLGRTEEEQKRTATIVAEEDGTKLASLHRGYYLKISGGFDLVIVGVLKKAPMQRTKIDLQLLLTQFEDTQFFQDLYFSFLQLKCCQSLSLSAFSKNQKITLKKGQKYFCIVVSGTLKVADANGVTLSTIEKGGSFKGESVAPEGAVLMATSEGALAVLSKQSYESVTTSALDHVKQILTTTPAKRNRNDVQFVTDMFCHSYKTIPFFAALPSAILRKACCKHLGVREFELGSTIFYEGDEADHDYFMYIIISGDVQLEGTLTHCGSTRNLLATDVSATQHLSSGDEFGNFMLAPEGQENKRHCTAKVTSEHCVLATLDRNDFMRLCKIDEIEIWNDRFWKLMTTKEPSNDAELKELFDDLDKDGSGDLDRYEIFKLLDSLGRKPSEVALDQLMAKMDPDGSGDVDFTEFSSWWWSENEQQRQSSRQLTCVTAGTDVNAAFKAVDTDNSGVITKEELFAGLQKLGWATDEEELAINTLLVKFDNDGSGGLDMDEFASLIEQFEAGQGTLAMVDSKKAPSTVEFIDFDDYFLLHQRISKSIAPDFTEDEANASAMEDWNEDLQRFNNTNGQLDQSQFGHAMFQLVDEWCGGASSTHMIVSWLRMLFANIVSLYGKFQALSEINCIEDELMSMCRNQRNEDEEARKRAEQAFKQRAADEKARKAAQAKADREEKARLAREGKAGGKGAQKSAAKKSKPVSGAGKLMAKREERHAQEDKAAAEAKHAQDDKAAAEAKERARAKAAEERAQRLAAEREAKRLAAEEEAARLAAEREAERLAAEQEKARLQAEEDEAARLAAAADEATRKAIEEEQRKRREAEAERRRQQEEERARRQALADAEEERLRKQAEEWAETQRLRREAEAERLRLEEEAKAERLRLEAQAAAEAARAEAMAALDAEINEIDAALAALDDEEAELRRRLAAGDLTPEEEEAIRKRLAEIDAERAALSKRKQAALAAKQQLLDEALKDRAAAVNAELNAIRNKLSALDDEEAELMRRLASGELTPEEEEAVRKRLAEIAAEREALLEQRRALLEEQKELAKGAAAMAAALDPIIGNIKKRLSALDDEEAELMRRLASGELSPEEEAAARKRLAEIAAERAALQAELDCLNMKNGLAAELANIDARLSALDDEEAELLRRLESGELSPEEEAAIRARLAEIAAERERLMDQRQVLLAEKVAADAAASEARQARELQALRNKLSALDDEEAELLRRLASGELSPEEEAAVRKRLAEIEAERAKLLKKLAKAEGRARNASNANIEDLSNCVRQLDNQDKSLIMTKLRALIRLTGKVKAAEWSDDVASLGIGIGAAAQESAAERRKRLRAMQRERARHRRAVLEASAAAAAGAAANQLSPGSDRHFRFDMSTRGHHRHTPEGHPDWQRWGNTAEMLLATQSDERDAAAVRLSEVEQLLAQAAGERTLESELEALRMRIEELDRDALWSEETEYHKQNVRPSTAQRKMQYADELADLRRRSSSEKLGRPSPTVQRRLMRAAKSVRRRSEVEYVAAKIAHTTNERVSKGFVLPSLFDGDPARSPTPSFRREQAAMGAAGEEPTPGGRVVTEAAAEQAVSRQSEARSAGGFSYDSNPNANYGRASRASGLSSRSSVW